MTIAIPNFNTEKVYDGLNTYTFTVNTAGMHLCRIKMDHRAASTMTIAITQAGSVNTTLNTITVASVPSGSPQTSTILQSLANCAIGDVLSFVITSSSTEDQQLNTIKATMNIHMGGLN
jgi:hypothetical protein